MTEREAYIVSVEMTDYFRIISKDNGLTPQECREELEAISMYTTSPALRAKCLAEMDRCDVPMLAANLR